MRNITVTFSDGTTHVYQNAPDDVTPELIQSRAERDFGKTVSALDGGKSQSIQSAQHATKPVAQQSRPEWNELPRNIPSSAAGLAKGLYQSVRHPVDTTKNLLTLGQGAAVNAMPDAYINWLDRVNPSIAGKRAQVSEVATGAGQALKQRYGGMENLRNTAITDPVGALADVSTVLTGGAALAGKVPMLAKAAPVLNKGAALTNPINLAVKPIVKTAQFVGKQGLGLTTLQGPDNIAQAAKAGLAGDKQFMRNLNQQVPYNQVLDDALAGVRKMKQDASLGYQQGIAGTKADKTILNFRDINSALNNQLASLKVTSGTSGKSKFVVGDDQIRTIQDIKGIVEEWRADRGLHTPEGLDALKRRIEAVPSEYGTAADKVKRSMYNTVKDTIVKQVPEYADTMKAYENAKNLETEITKTLSLGEKATEDTALRKLQQVARNNANTNFGHRLNLLKTLEEKGGVNLQSALAGQSMSPWMSRGLVGQGGMLGTTIGAAMSGNPAPLALLPLMSPKAVGATLYYGARPIGATGKALESVGITPSDLAKYGLLGMQTGRVNQ